MQLSDGGGGTVKNCRGEHRISRKDMDAKDYRANRGGRPRAREGEGRPVGTSLTEDNGCSLVLALRRF